QFEKRGIPCTLARDKAIHIIDSGADISLHAQLGMTASDLEKRRKMLHGIRQRILGQITAGKTRTVLKQPQEFLMDVGDLFVYPANDDGSCPNPYFAKGDPNWTQAGWSAAIIVDRGLTFDFLAWYRPLTITSVSLQKPTLNNLLAESTWILRRPGTCSPSHFN